MASPSSLPKKDEVAINWAELPQELMSAIMLRLSVIEKLESAQRVCTLWLRVCKDPSMWQKIDMRNLKTTKTLGSRYKKLEAMCRRAVDLSQGGLLEIKIQSFGSNKLLNYIADRSSKLRSLELADCEKITNFGISKVVVKLPLLEELSLSYTSTEELNLKVIGQACPNLKTLKLRFTGTSLLWLECDDDALAIAKTMPGLYHLELISNKLTDVGLNAILDNCPHLEHLDLTHCVFLSLVGDLEKRCLERIKHVIRPYAKTDYPTLMDVMQYYYESMMMNDD